MYKVQISGTGLYTPKEKISNEELVQSFNKYVDEFNEINSEDIKNGKTQPLEKSSAEFIEKASGVKSRYVQNKTGILDTSFMRPKLRERSEEELSNLAEMGVIAAKDAIKNSNIDVDDIDAVIVACSNLERAYPAIAIEIQNALGIKGFAFDMNVACSSATFGIQTIFDMVKSGSIKSAIMINPEICTGHLNFRDRDCHFIFGDVATAVILERLNEENIKENSYEIIGTRLLTKFSNNIRNNYGFLNNSSPDGVGQSDKLFHQNGRKVFKEAAPKELAPVVLDEYANTSSAGSIIAFHKYNKSLNKNDLAIICSFGAGYSVGNVIVKKIA